MSKPPAISVAPDIAGALRDQLPVTAARTVDAVMTEVDEYAGPLRGDLGPTIGQAVALALATFLRIAEEADPGERERRLGPALEAAYALGRGEARSGRTMTALLAAYRVGARVAWESWGPTALRSGMSEEIVPFAALVFAFIDQLSAASVNGHTDELATTGRVREHYLERLAAALVGGENAEEIARRADRADWPLRETLTCLLAPSAHTVRVRSLVDAGTLSVSADVVDAAPHSDMTVHLLPDLGPRRAELLDALHGRAWVLGPERPLSEARVSYRRACRALDRFTPRGQVIDTEAHLAELVVTADGAAYDDLRASALAPLADLSPEVAARLAATLRSWLLHQGRRDAVAADLVVHPQTVRYRMSQIRDRFGDRLLAPESVAELVIALTPPHTEPSRPPALPHRGVEEQ